MSREKIFIIASFLILLFLTGLLLILEKWELSTEKPKTATIIQGVQNYNVDRINQKENLMVTQESDIWIRPNINPFFVPYRDWNVEDPQIEAKSAIVVEMKNGQERILFQKNITDRLPIASLTKIMTALIVLENMDLAKIIKINKEAINQEGEAGKLVAGEEISVKNLLYAMLLESSNDAAFAVTSDLGMDYFINLMNEKAKVLQLNNTHFSSPLGFDDEQNFSTAYDFVKLINYSLNNQFLWQILRTSLFEASDISGTIFHRWETTNKLLGILSNVFGGKTGWTLKAGGCMALVIDNPKNDSKIISVLLGAPDENKRFEKTKKLIDWIFKAYQW